MSMNSPQLPDYAQANAGSYTAQALGGIPPLRTGSAANTIENSDTQEVPSSTALGSAAELLVAGLRDGARAFAELARASPTGPLVIEHGDRRMALGRKRMESMSGRNAALYLKSKFGLLAATAPVRIEAAFRREQDGALEWMEVDMDAWEELVPHMHRLLIRS
ncbi:hypothetical protein BD626DRAFT_473067 [Schizophyllum amplum]|uniref:Uncharacterized protein n=1 Tax=Schizophyllum amplum TaxID=97359 RepID=A0A550CWI1_9AGAR|nr:hypothetical protein BD626DRAFT_473067 [Auriculariopsis ampla]